MQVYVSESSVLCVHATRMRDIFGPETGPVGPGRLPDRNSDIATASES